MKNAAIVTAMPAGAPVIGLSAANAHDNAVSIEQAGNRIRTASKAPTNHETGTLPGAGGPHLISVPGGTTAKKAAAGFGNACRSVWHQLICLSNQAIMRSGFWPK